MPTPNMNGAGYVQKHFEYCNKWIPTSACKNGTEHLSAYNLSEEAAKPSFMLMTQYTNPEIMANAPIGMCIGMPSKIGWTAPNPQMSVNQRSWP